MANAPNETAHVYEVRPRRDKRSFDLISDVLPFGRLWYSEPNAICNAVGYAKFRSRSHDAVIRVYDDAGNVTTRTNTRANFANADSRLRGPGIKRGLTWSGLVKLARKPH
jgi:hypothetical protein